MNRVLRDFRQTPNASASTSSRGSRTSLTSAHSSSSSKRSSAKTSVSSTSSGDSIESNASLNPGSSSKKTSQKEPEPCSTQSTGAIPKTRPRKKKRENVGRHIVTTSVLVTFPPEPDSTRPDCAFQWAQVEHLNWAQARLMKSQPLIAFIWRDGDTYLRLFVKHCSLK